MFSIGASAQGLKLTPEIIDLGKTKIGEIKNYSFLIQNTGSKSLAIKNIVGDCGCLSFKWSKKNLHPNQIDTIFGTIRISNESKFHKTILIYSNSSNSFLTVSIIGEGVLQK